MSLWDKDQNSSVLVVPITDISEVEINATIGVHILSSVCPNAKLQSKQSANKRFVGEKKIKYLKS